MKIHMHIYHVQQIQTHIRSASDHTKIQVKESGDILSEIRGLIALTSVEEKNG